MDEYDDHDYCDLCSKHTVRCYCFTVSPPEVDDQVCRTPNGCQRHVTAPPNEWRMFNDDGTPDCFIPVSTTPCSISLLLQVTQEDPRGDGR